MVGVAQESPPTGGRRTCGSILSVPPGATGKAIAMIANDRFARRCIWELYLSVPRGTLLLAYVNAILLLLVLKVGGMHKHVRSVRGSSGDVL